MTREIVTKNNITDKTNKKIRIERETFQKHSPTNKL